MSKKMKTYYIHTLNNSPAYYDGEQLVYAGNQLSQKYFCESLKEIVKQKKLSDIWRLEQGFEIQHMLYGYFRIRLEVQK